MNDMKMKDVKPYLAAVFAGLLLACPLSAGGRTGRPQNAGRGASQIENDPGLAEAEQLNDQVLSLLKDRKYDKALPLAQRVLTIRERVLGPDHPLVGSALRNVADIQFA